MEKVCRRCVSAFVVFRAFAHLLMKLYLSTLHGYIFLSAGFFRFVLFGAGGPVEDDAAITSLAGALAQ